MPQLNLEYGVPAAKTEIAHTNNDPFGAADDITTSKICRVTQIHATIPVGETAAIDHISASGKAAPLIAGMIDGTYYVGSPFLLFPGESLRPSSQSIVAGDRELVFKAEKVVV